MKKSEYIIIIILIFGCFGVLGYFIGEEVKREIKVGTDGSLIQTPHTDAIAGRDSIKINT